MEEASDPGSPPAYQSRPRDFLHQDWADTQVPDQFADLDGYSVTDLLLEYLGSLAPRRRLLDRKELLQDSNLSPPTLKSLTIRTVIQTLKIAKQNGTLNDEFISLLSRLPENDIRRLFEDPQMPYVILRRFLLRWRESPPVCEEGASAGLVDIDEMVLQHERYLRSLLPSALDPQMMVTFGDLKTYYDCPYSIDNTDQDFVSFTRQDPPDGGLELLDHRRPHRLRINVDNKTFAADFNCATTGVFEGLDWANVLVSGESVMRVLLKASSNANTFQFGLNTISMHLWGLSSATEALQKIESLYDVWSTKMASINVQVRCLKRRNSIYFISKEWGQSVKINLKLFKNPFDVLLQERIDLCGIGFDGSQVLMLPSCLRALETGYNTFSSRYLYDDLTAGYYRNDLIASYYQDADWLYPYCPPTESRVDIFKLHHFAALGFGLRILPSYAKSLNDEIKVPRLIGDDGLQNSCFRAAASRGEPGIKILKRLEFLGRRWIQAVEPDSPFSFRDLSLRTHCEKMRKIAHGKWKSAYEEASASVPESLGRGSDPGDTFRPPSLKLNVQFFTCASKLMCQPHFRPTNLFCFETFLRQCQLSYNLHMGDDTGKNYDWESSQDYEDSRNDDDTFGGVDAATFTMLREFICTRLNIPWRHDGWVGYVTRRIRSKHCGEDLAAILEKQLVVPVIIPYDLEQHIKQVVEEVRVESGVEIPEFLIPIHEQGEGRGLIPDYTETTDSKIGNLKYWVLSNEMLWRGVHPRIDEIFHVLDILYQVFLSYEYAQEESGQPVEARIDTEFFKNSLGAIILRRPPADLEDCLPDGTKADSELVMATGASDPLYAHCAITAKEALKFRRWVFGGPDIPVYYEEGVPKYPFPDELFWTEGREGASGGEEVPQWTDMSAWDVERGPGCYFT